MAATDTRSLQEQLSLGDEIEILRKDGTEVRFEVDTIDNNGVGGDGIYVAFEDINELAVRKASIGKNTLLGIGILMLVILIGLYSIDEDDIFTFR